MEKGVLELEQGVPKKFSAILLLLLTIITFGIYNYVWFIINSNKLNNLRTKSKLNKKIALVSLIIYIMIIILGILLLIITNSSKDSNSALTNVTKISDIPIQFIVVFITALALIVILAVLILFLAFKTKRILNETLENKGENVKLSGLFTFLYNLFYLQYEINRIIGDKENNKRIGPWVIFIFLILIIIAVPLIFYLLSKGLISGILP